VGRHSTPEELPPPKDKPRYRFVIAISAIALLAFASMALVAAVFPQNAPQAEASPADPGLVGIPSQFPGSQSGAAAPVTSPPPPATGPATGPVAGTFVVSQDWADGFIGAVQLSNATPTAQAWRVQLVFPANVGALQARWISGGPGDTTVARAGQTVTFTSQVPLAAGAHIGVFFQFAKTGGNPAASACSVNGHACTP
jgi:Cellulose binding domain